MELEALSLSPRRGFGNGASSFLLDVTIKTLEVEAAHLIASLRRSQCKMKERPEDLQEDGSGPPGTDTNSVLHVPHAPPSPFPSPRLASRD